MKEIEILVEVKDDIDTVKNKLKDFRIILDTLNEQINEITSKLESNREIRYFSRYTKTNCFYTIDNKIYYQDKEILDCSELKIRGRHNHENICACLSATIDLIDLDKSLETIKKFSGVEHRLEFVREINGAKWYNDS